MADEKQVFGFLVGFVVLCFLLITTSNLIDSVIDQAEMTGSEVFETQKYMAGAVNLYAQGESFGVYRAGEAREDLCRFDSPMLEEHSLGFDIRYGGQYDKEQGCHLPQPYMSTPILNRFNNERYSGIAVETLEVGQR